MRRFSLIITSLIALSGCAATAKAPINNAPAPKPAIVDNTQVGVSETGAAISITVSGIKEDGGFIAAALLTQGGYDSDEPVQTRRANVSGNSVNFSFDDVPSGSYAIKLYHDANGNGQLDTNNFGIPSEDYGFSNNASGMMGPPSWEDAKFSLGADNVVQTIKLK